MFLSALYSLQCFSRNSFKHDRGGERSNPSSMLHNDWKPGWKQSFVMCYIYLVFFVFVFILFIRLSISFFITSSQMSSVLVSMRLKFLMILMIMGMNDVMCGTVSYHSASPHCWNSILCRQPPLRKGGVPELSRSNRRGGSERNV